MTPRCRFLVLPPSLYSLDWDVLKVCYAGSKDAKRPKEFKTDKGSDQLLLVLKRQKS